MNLEIATLQLLTCRNNYNIYIKIILDKGCSLEYTNIRNGERARAKDVEAIQPAKGFGERKLNKFTLSMD